MTVLPTGRKDKFVLLNKEEINRALSRIAHEILEKNQSDFNFSLVGIKRRGAPLAKRLQAKIKQFEKLNIETGQLDITYYRDDLSTIAENPLFKDKSIDFSVEGKTIILVDDVIYTGRTCRAAIEAIFDLGRPKSIQLAILIDRGHRELPIRPDYVGKNVPTSKLEQVVVDLEEIDGIDQVYIQNQGQHG